MKFYVYILYSQSLDKYYVGFSSDPWKRLEQHLSNEKDKYTSKAQDWKLSVVFFVSENKSETLKVERYIKKQKSRKLIEKLVHPEFKPDGFLAQLVRVPHLLD